MPLPFGQKLPVDHETWKLVLRLSSGTPEEKFEAARLIMEKSQQLPHQELIDLLKRMIAISEPEVGKIQLAKVIAKGNVRSDIFDLISSLSTDPSDVVREQVRLSQRDLELELAKNEGKIREIKPRFWQLKRAWQQSWLWVKEERLKISVGLAVMLAVGVVLAVNRIAICHAFPFETLAQINATIFALAFTIPLAASQFAKYQTRPESFFDTTNIAYFLSYAFAVLLPLVATIVSNQDPLYSIALGWSILCMALLFPFLFRTSNKLTTPKIIEAERKQVVKKWMENDRSEYGASLENIARSAFVARDYQTFAIVMDALMILVNISMALPWEWSSTPLQPGGTGLAQAVTRVGEATLEDKFAIALWCTAIVGLATRKKLVVDDEISASLKLAEYNLLNNVVQLSSESKDESRRIVALYMIEWGIFNQYTKPSDMDSAISRCASALCSFRPGFVDSAFERTRQRIGQLAMLETSTTDPIRPLPFTYNTIFRRHLNVTISRLHTRVSEIFVDRYVAGIGISSRRVIWPNTPDWTMLSMLQRKCYAEQAKSQQDWEILPLVETSADMRDEASKWFFLEMVIPTAGSVPIGSVRGRKEGNKCLIRRLFVHPSFRKLGIGTELLHSIEAKFPDARIFEAYIGNKIADTVIFLQNRGYSISREFTLSNGLTYTYMSKTNVT